MSLHYFVKYECQKTGENLKYLLWLIDKSQGSTAKHLSCDGLLYDKFISQFFEKKNLKSVNVWRSYRQNGWLCHQPDSPYTFAHKDAELAR